VLGVLSGFAWVVKHAAKVGGGKKPPRGSPDRPWVLAIRELGQDGVHTLVFLHAYPTVADAKEAGERWKGPPPQ
jgi:hypothetical protein